MGKIVNINAHDVNAEAIAWVVKLDGARLSTRKFSEFRTWHARSPAHAAAFSRAASTWGELDILTELPLMTAATEKAPFYSRFLNWMSGSLLRPQFAAAFALIVMAGLSIAYFNSAPAESPPAIYTTGIGSTKSIHLNDGSHILLNTASHLEIRYSQDRRLLKLVKGQAHFDVAHDPSRPFEVHTGTNIVRAVGTAFTVELKQGMVEVTVTEGKVQLAALQGMETQDIATAETPLALIVSGQSAQFAEDIKSVVSIDREEMNRRMAWQTGGLIFKGETLEEVIQEVSRYTTTEITIADPRIRHLKIGGYYKTTETDAMLLALEKTFDISVRHVGRNRVHLYGAASE